MSHRGDLYVRLALLAALWTSTAYSGALLVGMGQDTAGYAVLTISTGLLFATFTAAFILL